MQTMDIASVQPQIGDPAPDVDVILAEDASPFALSRLWENGPAVLVFLRHVGCTFCREHVTQLRQDIEEFSRRGVRVGFITVGKTDDTHLFCTERGLATPFVCLSDPEKASYRAYGLSRCGAHEFLTPHVLARGFQAALHGHFNGMPKGDPLQMPGVFIVDRNGVVRHAHRHKDAADNPANSALFAILDRLD